MSNLPLHRLRCALLLTAVTSLVLLAVLNTAVRAAQRWALHMLRTDPGFAERFDRERFTSVGDAA